MVIECLLMNNLEVKNVFIVLFNNVIKLEKEEVYVLSIISILMNKDLSLIDICCGNYVLEKDLYL